MCLIGCTLDQSGKGVCFPWLKWEWTLCSCVQLFRTPWIIGYRLLCSWNSPGKNTGVGVPIARGSSQPRGQTKDLSISGGFFLSEPPGKPRNTGTGSLSLLQGICPTQKSTRGVLHCRLILYPLRFPISALCKYGMVPACADWWHPGPIRERGVFSPVKEKVPQLCPTL